MHSESLEPPESVYSESRKVPQDKGRGRHPFIEDREK